MNATGGVGKEGREGDIRGQRRSTQSLTPAIAKTDAAPAGGGLGGALGALVAGDGGVWSRLQLVPARRLLLPTLAALLRWKVSPPIRPCWRAARAYGVSVVQLATFLAKTEACRARKCS